MYAVVGVWNMDPGRREEQDRGLRELIIPAVRSHPGFVAGYWMRDPETGKGHTTIVLDSEPSARAFKDAVLGNARDQAKAGITNDSLAVVELLARSDHRPVNENYQPAGELR
jgi:hypothetical protein